MPSVAVYAARKTRGICPKHPTEHPLPGYVKCERCHDADTHPNTRLHMHLVRTSGIRSQHHQHSDPGPSVLLAHCGAWHTVQDIPFVTPCCGAVVFTEYSQSMAPAVFCGWQETLPGCAPHASGAL